MQLLLDREDSYTGCFNAITDGLKVIKPNLNYQFTKQKQIDNPN